MEAEIIETDVLIIGGGIAGCRAAITAHDRGTKVLLVTKGLFGMDAAATWEGGAGYTCWGCYPHDTLDLHAEDTIRCGWFLNNQDLVYTLLSHAPDNVRDLLNWGARYRVKEGKVWPVWQLSCSTKEGRSVTPAQWPRSKQGDVLSLVLPRAVKKRRVNILEDTFVLDLLTKGDTVVGALGVDIRNGKLKVLRAKATILATGGYQGLYPISLANTNLTGDGQAMALRAGVDMMDFEFTQTLPAAVWPPILAGKYLPFTLIMEWGARMYNSEGERFITKWDPVKMEHTSRAMLSRSIFHEIRAGKTGPHGGIYVSVAHQPRSYIVEKLKEMERTHNGDLIRKSGIDLAKDGIETKILINYCQGGCAFNANCETDKPGLYAIGEVVSGKDGADRMTSNALPYCDAMGLIAGGEAVQRAGSMAMPEIDKYQVAELERRALAPLEREDGVSVYKVKSHFQDSLYDKIGYGRTEEGLQTALRLVEKYKKEIMPNLYSSYKGKRFNMEWINTLEFENLVLVAECIIRNALMRKESRGLHDRLDYPNPSPDWFKNIHLRLVNGELQQWTTPVEWTHFQPEPGSLGEPWHRGRKVKEYTGWRADPLYERMR